MVYDSARHKVILFGGQTIQGSLFGGQTLASNNQLLNDMWEWDGGTRTWTEITRASGPIPSPRSFFGMGYDPLRGKVVLFGGKVDAIYYNTNGESWEWDPVARIWANFPAANTILYGGLRAMQLAFDPNLGQVILLGGIQYTGTINGFTYSWNGSDWLLRSTTGPSGRVGHAMATDSARSRVVMFGGFGGSDSSGLYNWATWEWNGNNWIRYIGPGPGIRGAVGMAYDATRNVSVLFGGTSEYYSNAPPVFNDLWQWNGSTWSDPPTINMPPPRDTVLAFDGSHIILFGGRVGSGNALGDTLILSPGDTTAPVTSVSTSATPNDAGWSHTDVAVGLNTTDNSGGSGIASITYSASGAMPIGSTNVNASSAYFVISAEGTTTITYYAKDVAGNIEAPHTLTVRIDKTPPAVSCGSADGSWHGANVSIACSSGDATSGLDSAIDANFTISTSVPSGTETANATTSARQVCDATGNCSQAGPVSGNKVDRKAPAIVISSPLAQSYNFGQSVTVGYACTDGGSGVSTCTGTSHNGSVLDTSTVGAHVFTVTATDAAGNSASPATVTYSVVDTTPPLITPTVSGPLGNNGWYVGNVVVSWSVMDPESSVSASPGCSTSNITADTTGVTFTCSATSGGGTETRSVTIKRDATAPLISNMPSNLTAEAAGANGKTVVYGQPSATDSVSGIVTLICSPASGGTFAIGTTQVVCTATDNAGNSGTANFNVTVADTTPPVLSNISGNLIVQATGASGAVVTWSSPTAADEVDGAVAVNCSRASGSTFAHGVTTVTCTAADSRNNTASRSFTVEVKNAPPTANAGNPYQINEGGNVSLSGAGSDPEGSALAYAWDLDNNGSFETAGQSVTFSAGGMDGFIGASRTVKLRVTDTAGLTAVSTAVVNILNVAPTITSLAAPASPQAVNTNVTLSLNFTDPAGSLDTYTPTTNWGDGVTDNSLSHVYTAAGVYCVKVVVSDEDGGVSAERQYEYVVVYDPGAGFVTGGGWIMSPAGAYAPNPSLTGKATFGFVSRYQRGANQPTGNTEFQFHAGDFRFSSTAYEWLVVAGARAQYKGTGTVNGVAGFSFLLTATDGQVSGGGGTDKFRIKIWNAGGVVYDNVVGGSDKIDDASPQEVGDGNIMIHPGN